jgi:hypothetical protein
MATNNTTFAKHYSQANNLLLTALAKPGEEFRMAYRRARLAYSSAMADSIEQVLATDLCASIEKAARSHGCSISSPEVNA